MVRISKSRACSIGRRIGVDQRVNCDELRRGIVHEAQEHRDVIGHSTTKAAKIAAAHLRENPAYYSMLDKVEHGKK